LSRSDYGEKDRILTVITPNNGKLRAIAKGVRSGKSRLAGGIELFAENELSLAEGRGSLHTVTFSRMKRYFGEISKDLDKSMYAYDCLKLINKLTPDEAGGEYYPPLVNLLSALSEGKVPLAQIKIWFSLRVLDELGASPNFDTDTKDSALAKKGTFEYDFDRHAFYEKPDGPYGTDHIKLLRYIQKLPRPKEIKLERMQVIEKTENLVRLIFLNQTG
jgi:DNA repair protein RecO